MKYSRFEWLTLGVGAVAVVGTLLASLRGTPVPQEIVGQVLLLGVLVGAVHWGRNGGFIAAVGAVLAYVLMRVPVIMAEGMSADVQAMLLVRIATYGAIGILGGELCGRIKYFFTALEDSSKIDDITLLYNQTFMRELVESQLAQHIRYGALFSVVLVEIAPQLTSELRTSKQRSILRGAGNLIRNDLRLVDEVGRLDDGRFLLVLPHTPKAGAEIAGERVRRALREYLGAKDTSVTAEVYCVLEDDGVVRSLLASIGGENVPVPLRSQASSA